MAKDFSAPHGGVYGVHFAKRWMQTFEVVRRRPEFRPIAIHTLSKARNGNKQILSVQFRNFILEGTWPRIMEVLFMRIIQATEDFFEGDTAAQMAASNAAEMAASNAAEMAASNAAQMAAINAAAMDAAESAAVIAAINDAMADSNDSQELI
jgi:fibrillarin-like rRNA methylase